MKWKWNKYLTAFLSVALGKHGFKAVKSAAAKITLVRPVEAGQQNIGMFLEGSSPEFECSVYFEGENARVKEILEPFAEKRPSVVNR